MIGTSIAHYRITAKLGEGGMGAVYRATDTKLNRDVAIKILPEAFASDPDRFARFTREAQLLAALNHPSIAAIYGIEDRAIVMELIEGPTLEDRIAQGPLPLDEALAIARQIAEALETAHDKGIIHRDLKPANIKLTPDAKVKVLDFGLAKLHDPRDPAEDPASAPTVLRGNSPTISGMIMGTAEYMSPEQAAGKPVDKRADIWSFGVVLFEMLTGRRLFQAETVSHTLADVLRAPIDLTPAPAAIRPLLTRCLDRNPKTRLRDIGEARFALDNPPTAPDATPPPPPPRKPSLLPWIILSAAFATAAATLAFLHFRPTPPPPSVRFQIPGDNATFRSGAEISPDGKFLAYIQIKDGQSTLWLRPLNSTQPKRLFQQPGTLNNDPFWSPDSRWIAFASGTRLIKLDVTADSPSPITVCECIASAGNFRGGAWSPDGTILFAPTTVSALSRVPASGGTPSPLTTLLPGKETLHRWPHILPDGRHFLFFVGSGDPAHAGVYLASLDKPSPKRILNSDSHATFAPSSPSSTSGHLLFIKDSSLRAVPFDSKRLALSGEPVVLASSTRTFNFRGPFSVSQNGILTFWQGEPYPPVQLHWYSRGGKLLRPAFSGILPRDLLNGFDLSPNGKLLLAAFGSFFGGVNRIHLIDLEQSSISPIGPERYRGISPVWLPGTPRIALGYGPDGPFQLSELLLDRPFAPQRLHTAAQNAYPRSVSPDGSLLLFELDSGSKRETWAFSFSDRQLHPWLREDRMLSQSQFAPAATNPFWIAYTSNESGTDQIYTESFTREGQRASRLQLSTHGGFDPRWRPDGREIFFLAPGNKLMAATVLPNRQFARPEPLFQTPPLASATSMRTFRYAVSPDGNSFLIATAGEQSTEPLTVLLNWQSELPR